MTGKSVVRIQIDELIKTEALVPNPKTIGAVRVARRRKLPRFPEVDALMKDLNAGAKFKRDFRHEMKGRHH
jgi:hypothetical protein